MDEKRFPASAEWSAVMPSYDWLRNNDEQDVDYVYHGRMENLPRSTSKTVRIFLSSTFTDTYTERNLLMKNVFPEMRKYCRDKYDLDFQVVDMRWGVRHEASVDHSASELCLKEIKTCNEVSLGPTFVTLLSHRYGTRPLRTRIPEDEMNILMEELKKRPAGDLEFVLQWYQLDTNAIPHEYILKPLVKSDDMENFLQSEDTENREYEPEDYLSAIEYSIDPDSVDRKGKHGEISDKYVELLRKGNEEFEEADTRLKQILKEVAISLSKDKRLTKEQAERYYISVTEEEIIEGIRKNERRRDRCLAFIRQLDDIDLNHDLAWRFIDMTRGKKVDTESQRLLTTLREETIPQLLPPENIFRFTTAWDSNGGINEDKHATYLRQFCDTFKKALADQIDRGVHASKFSNDKLFSEILEHGHQCVGKVERFHGREEILGTIKDYVMSGSEQPLIIWGESGCGKTSVLAKAAKLVPEWLGDNKDLLIPIRFLGTTPDSSTIYQTLASVSQQIIKLCRLHDQFSELPQEFADLKDLFKDILAAVPQGKRVVLFLDSLDQLADTNAAHQLHWFPKTLPTNVKMVVSVLPKEHGILDRLKSMLTDEKHYIVVPNLQTETSHAILKLWLQLKKRTLSTMQETLIDELLKDSVRPLYLKLVFDEIYGWKSYEVPKFNCRTIESCLMRLYRRIETKHGRVLVSKSLGYLSASSNGLTELELEDILSLDEEVLNDVFQFHIPPIRRLPSILWARVRRDLDEYIVDREADGTKVMAWYHRQFIQQANKRYLGTSGGYYGSRVQKKYLPLYLNIRDYFAGIWAGNTPKPFVYSEWHCKKRNLKDPNSEAVRHVSAQPTLFAAPDGSIDIENPRYNLRKLSELPHACGKVVQHEDITPFIAKHISLNPEFLSAWIKNKPWQEVSEFVTEHSRESQHGEKSKEYTKVFKKQFEGQEITAEDKKLLEEATEELQGNAGLSLQMSTVHQCLLLSYISVLNNPTFLAADIAGRLLIYYGMLKGIDEWIEYVDTQGRQLCALVPPHLQLETPGSELLFIITNHDGPVLDAMWSTIDDNICFSFSSKLVAISMELGQVLIDTHPRSIPKGDFFKTAAVTHNTITACLSNHPWVYVFNETGDLLLTIKLEQHLKEDLKRLGMAEHQLRIETVRELDESNGEVMVLQGKFPHLILLHIPENLKDIEEKHQISVIERQNKGNILNFMAHETDGLLHILDDRAHLSRLELHYDEATGLVTTKEEEVFHNFIDVISAHDVKDASLMVGTMRGDIIIAAVKDKLILTTFDVRNQEGGSKYGMCHHVKQHVPKNSYSESQDLLCVACTSSHLLLLVPERCLKQDSSSDDDDSSNDEDDANDDDSEVDGVSRASKSATSSKKEKKVKNAKVGKLKLVLRVKREYTMAHMSPGGHLVIAARGGTLDLFQLSIPDRDERYTKRITGRFFTTIDAHGQKISKILTTNEDILFMTASWDGTLKFWMVARAGVTRKYIPNFDRADVLPDSVLAGEETALASGPMGRAVCEWNTVKGTIARIFEHPSKREYFHCFTTDLSRSKLYAIGSKGMLYIWSLAKRQDPPQFRGLRRKATSKHGVEEAKKATRETPSDTLNLTNAIPLEQSLLTTMFSVNKGILIEGSDKCFYHVETEGTAKIERMDHNTVSEKWQLSERHVLFLADNSTVEIMFQLYDAEKKAFSDTYARDVGPADSGFTRAKLLKATGELVIPRKMELILWNPLSSQKRKVTVKDIQQPEVYTSDSGICIAYCLHNKCTYQGFKVTPEHVVVESWTREISQVPKELNHLTLTHDGKYLLYVTERKMLHLRRYSDGKLLALYTMYDNVCSLSVSTNNWFVLLGTLDKRLFTLIIADPNEREHDDRIAYARTMNPGLSMEQAMALMGEANAFEGADSEMDSDYDSSDDEALMRAAEKRLDKRGADGNMIFCLQSDDDSSSESDGDLRPGTRQVLTRESTRIHVFNSGLHPTAHDGEIFTPSPCTLQ